MTEEWRPCRPLPPAHRKIEMTQDTNTTSGAAERHYADRDHMELGGYYVRHVSAMTGEALHAKSKIAAELGWRDREIDRLRAALASTPAQPVAEPAGAVSEMVKFTDQSTANPIEKARRYLAHVANKKPNNHYLFDDGYPRESIADDAAAALSVLEQLAASRGQALRLLTQKEKDSLGRRADGMDGNEWDQWVQEKFAQVNGLRVQGGNYAWYWG